jgi:hypothetical protein
MDEGRPHLIAREHEQPSYQRMLQLLKQVEGTRAGKNWIDRIGFVRQRDERLLGGGGDADAGVGDGSREVEGRKMQSAARDIITGT